MNNEVTKSVTFGSIVSGRRKLLGITQKDLAAAIIKQDGKPISSQYLNDIELGRRGAPSDHLIDELAMALKLDRNALYHAGGKVPCEQRGVQYEPAEPPLWSETLMELRDDVMRTKSMMDIFELEVVINPDSQAIDDLRNIISALDTATAYALRYEKSHNNEK